MGALGDTLRERRTALGITLEQAESATRIRARLLEALESGEYDRLPAPGYVRGYVSSYSRFLELDPVPMLALYKAESGDRTGQTDLNLPQINEAVAPRGEQHAVPWKAAVSILLVISLLSLSIWIVTRIWGGPEPTPPEPTVPTPTTTTVEPTETTTIVEPADKPPARELPFTLTVKVSEEGASWVRVTVDGMKAYEGTLTGGQSKEFEVSSTASVRLGKPSEVTVLRDGEEIDIPEGDTPTLTLKASTER